MDVGDWRTITGELRIGFERGARIACWYMQLRRKFEEGRLSNMEIYSNIYCIFPFPKYESYIQDKPVSSRKQIAYSMKEESFNTVPIISLPLRLSPMRNLQYFASRRDIVSGDIPSQYFGCLICHPVKFCLSGLSIVSLSRYKQPLWQRQAFRV